MFFRTFYIFQVFYTVFIFLKIIKLNQVFFLNAEESVLQALYWCATTKRINKA